MRENLTTVPEWNAWQEKTGELPPDFDTLPRSEFLPDPLRFLDGRPVATSADWSARRDEILDQYEHYFFGRFPPKPALTRVVAVESTAGDGYHARTVQLVFGPEDRGTLRVKVTVPDGPGPHPAVITTSLDGWAEHLIPRGYAAVGFAGNDFMDDTADLPELYPDYDFAALPRRAWAVQLVVDYLETRADIDHNRIGLYGYSRDGKMATIAAAIEPRIAAVMAGSTGVGGVLPWRLAGEFGMGESIESTTMMFPHWFHPRMRFFAGHEDRLPVDANLLVAAIAPRACLMQYGLNDEVSNVWANEQSFASAQRVYALLGHPERLSLLRGPGFHGSIDPQKCLDWLDLQFGHTADKAAWSNDRMFAWDWEVWRSQHAAEFDPKTYPVHAPGDFSVESTRAAVRAMLGPTPPQPPTPVPFWRRGPAKPVPGPTYAQGSGPGQLTPDVPAWVASRGRIQEFGWLAADNDTVDSIRVSFGRGLHGDLFFPRDRPEGKRLPTVIWLHGYSYPLGYMWVYRRDLHPILALAQAGYAVLAFDQSGFGSRQAETAPFYERYPEWSRLGRMVNDVSAAIDALDGQDLVDGQRIYALGYTLGGAVGLHAAALDERVRGVVSIAGFSPLRSDTVDSIAGGIARFSHQRSLLPKLGFFIGEEARIPYDYDGLLATIAPRPVLVVQPTMGRGTDPAAVRAAVERARPTFAQQGSAADLTLLEPHDYTRFPTVAQEAVIAWMKTHLP
ncbi:alpha/beta fold hydrolase [Synoicihabitans lomoniglobus]|uniref:Alpha/beta fold hydrolase n=1 Tax=Synoicihabitans lomoniglobus TaxID=2909285 RepID=A0AAE9ZUB5_9BACT|nr:alpha/beta fold hydrolase [Opitutaceae bacterium LMO-M01]WED64242.1 alpha/beta fold hydrolase [Opitutaceae bacterium LMO-M01]